MRKPVKIRITMGNMILLFAIFAAIYFSTSITTTKSVSNMVNKSIRAEMTQTIEKYERAIKQSEQDNKWLRQEVSNLNTKVDIIEESRQELSDKLAKSNVKFDTLWNSLDPESKKKFDIIQSQQKHTDRGSERKTYTMKATSYSVTIEDCGKLDGITFSGRKVKEKWTVAVDPRIIPLGSVLYIEFPDPLSHMNGYYRAQDIGGAIKGMDVDIFIDDVKEAKRFGVRTVKVTVVELPTKKY